MVFSPCPKDREGGLAILIQQQLPFRTFPTITNNGGQFLAVEVTGIGGTDLTIATAYSFCKQTSLQTKLEEWCRSLSRRPAVLTGDFNDLARNSNLTPMLNLFQFRVGAAGGHTRSTTPIDMICHKGLEGATGGVHPDFTAKDHDLLFFHLPLTVSTELPTYKLARCAPQNFDSFSNLQNSDFVFDNKTWQTLLRNADITNAWTLWSNTVETTLSNKGMVKLGTYRSRGSLPQVRQAEGKHGRGQSHYEREVRRVIRRVREAATQTRRRGAANIDPLYSKSSCVAILFDYKVMSTLSIRTCGDLFSNG